MLRTNSFILIKLSERKTNFFSNTFSNLDSYDLSFPLASLFQCQGTLSDADIIDLMTPYKTDNLKGINNLQNFYK